MNIDVAPQRILVLKDQIRADDAEKKAWEKKTNAFDAISKVTSFLSRPKDEDFTLVYREHRYQPVWHVKASARYVYDRNTSYQVPVSGREVQSVTLHATEYQTTNTHIHVPVTEHCTQEEHEEVLLDGVTGNHLPDASLVLKPSDVVKGALEKAVSKDAILVPPQVRVSAIVRDALSKMIKGIQADTILEEKVDVSVVDLIYRPVYAFQFQWKSKGKEGILEIDGVTGDIASGTRIFREYLGKVIDPDFLFDIGADAAGMFIPGGSIAVKAARKYITTKKK